MSQGEDAYMAFIQMSAGVPIMVMSLYCKTDGWTGNSSSIGRIYSRLSRKWAECIDKEWLREVERKEKGAGNLLEKYVSSSAQVLGDVQMDR